MLPATHHGPRQTIPLRDADPLRPRRTRSTMVDEPRVSTRPNVADSAVRSTSQYEVEWRDGLSRLMSNLEGELGRALDGARRQATDAVKGIERQGLDLLT